MRIIINHSSMTPIYEQIVEQVKTLIRNEKLKENDNLPSVRSLAKELKISALTVKKSIRQLRKRRIYSDRPRKRNIRCRNKSGTFTGRTKKELEADLEQAIQKGRRYGIRDEDIKSLFELILEG